VPDRWRSADSAGAVSPTATLWSQDRVSCRGRAGRQSQHVEGQRASQRAAYPGSGIERPVFAGRHGVLTCRGPVNRVAQWQVSGRPGIPTAPTAKSRGRRPAVAGLGYLDLDRAVGIRTEGKVTRRIFAPFRYT
jgi:hypothetical protein